MFAELSLLGKGPLLVLLGRDYPGMGSLGGPRRIPRKFWNFMSKTFRDRQSPFLESSPPKNSPGFRRFPTNHLRVLKYSPRAGFFWSAKKNLRLFFSNDHPRTGRHRRSDLCKVFPGDKPGRPFAKAQALNATIILPGPTIGPSPGWVRTLRPSTLPKIDWSRKFPRILLQTGLPTLTCFPQKNLAAPR